MNRKQLNKIVTVAAIATASTLAGQALAVPVNGFYVEDARCDNIPSQSLTHELGEVQFFPINEALQIFVAPTTNYICVPDDGIANDWSVQINNISGQAWTNLFFVADLGLSIGNADGTAFDTAPLPGAIVDAFRIDGTVTPGMNNNLAGESGTIDEILSPGESWRFFVTNYADSAGSSPMPLFRNPGVFANTEPFLGAAAFSTANILANPVVPEPSMFGFVGIGLLALMLRRPSRTLTEDSVN